MAILAYLCAMMSTTLWAEFASIALMEDYDFVRRLEAHGNTCFI